MGPHGLAHGLLIGSLLSVLFLPIGSLLSVLFLPIIEELSKA
jgi:hypothetical protein